MNLWENIKRFFRGFVAGRHGADQLCMAMLWTGLGVYVLGAILGSFRTDVTDILQVVFTLISFGLYLVCIYRMFSRKHSKRSAENRRYVAMVEQVKTNVSQARVRFRNRHKYKYFRCPGCKARHRIPRGSGVVTVTCSRCHGSFTQKG